jgi:LPPG:FO 2-phospho-L-lactate transferase
VAHRLAEGARLTEVTAEITRTFGLGLRLLPVSDDAIRTKVTTHDGGTLTFQEYFVRAQHDVDVATVRFSGAIEARPTPEATVALRDAAVVVIAPSNPIVSVGPVLAVPGIGEALTLRRESVIAVSPIVGGAALKGPAARLMTNLGEEASVVGVARRYAPFASALIIDTVDADLAGAVGPGRHEPIVAPSIMDTPDHAAALARVCLAGRAL